MTSLFLHSTPGDRRVTIFGLVVAFAIASVFYRFGSFALECVAFLLTWAVIDYPVQWLVQRFRHSDQIDRPAG